MSKIPVVAIIGGGCSGVMTAMQILRASLQPLKILLFEKNQTVGLGLAYSTPYEGHLLNVPASKMSLFPDAPHDFLDYLTSRQIEAAPHDFLPRLLYGQYIQDRFQTCLKSNDTLSVVNQEVVSVERPDQWVIYTDSGESFHADKIILATGNLPPNPLFKSLRCLSNPWDFSVYRSIPSDHDIVIMGSGLTMIDVVLFLKHHHHRGKIYALSRRGLLPLSHGGPLQAGLDLLRPRIDTTWANFSLAHKKRFLRHLNPYWNIYRHRVPPKIAEQMMQLQTQGQLFVKAGRIREIAETENRLQITFQEKGQAHSEKIIETDWMINCSGPNTNYAKVSGFISKLIDRGFVQPDCLGLGLEVNETFTDVLFVLGPPSKGKAWEVTAVPDIRVQAQAIVNSTLSAISH